MKNWYSIKNKSAGELNVSIHEEIGMWGITAAEFIDELRAPKNVDKINLSIHTPGGSVLDGFAMYNALKSHPAKVYGHVEGIAASAGSFILMASDYISMPEDSWVMIHNAYGGAFGDSEEIRKAADIVEKLQDSVINIYHKRTGKDVNELADMMKEETWMNAHQAVEHGFADTITDAIGVASRCHGFEKYFKSMPVKNEIDISSIDTIKEFERYLRDSGISRSKATALSSRAKVVFQSDSDNDDELAGIADLLNKFKVPESLNQK